MRDLIQNFESRPRHVQAILWDGSNKQAKQIVKTLHLISTVDAFFDAALKSKLGELHEEIQFFIESNTTNGHKSIWPKANEWIVIWPEGDVEAFSAEAFADTFRVVTNG